MWPKAKHPTTTCGLQGLQHQAIWVCAESAHFFRMRQYLSYLYIYLLHSKALNKCKIIICMGVDGVMMRDSGKMMK